MEVKNVCVVGMGTMGSQIGIVCARAGFNTTMVDVSTERVESDFKTYDLFSQSVEETKLDQHSMDEILERIHASINLREAVAEANIVIERYSKTSI